MATELDTLTVQLQVENPKLLEEVARLRTRQNNLQTPVDLGPYILALLNKDVAACLEEIKARGES